MISNTKYGISLFYLMQKLYLKSSKQPLSIVIIRNVKDNRAQGQSLKNGKSGTRASSEYHTQCSSTVVCQSVVQYTVCLLALFKEIFNSSLRGGASADSEPPPTNSVNLISILPHGFHGIRAEKSTQGSAVLFVCYQSNFTPWIETCIKLSYPRVVHN